jgi:hypothetical protein
MAKKVFDLQILSADLEDQKSYKKRLHLGNGKYIIFTSKIELRKYGTETRRYFWHIVAELNELYCQAFALYREAWLVNARCRRTGRYSSLLEQVAGSLAVAVSWLDKLAGRLVQSNEPSYICLNAGNAVAHFKEALLPVEALLRDQQIISRANTALVYIGQLDQLALRIRNYGNI